MISAFLSLSIIVFLISFVLAWRSVGGWPRADGGLSRGNGCFWKIREWEKITGEKIWREYWEFARENKLNEVSSLEILWQNDQPVYYLFIPEPALFFWKSRLELEQTEDPLNLMKNLNLTACELMPKYDFFLPLKTKTLEGLVDDLLPENVFYLQIVFSCVKEGWQKKMRKKIEELMVERTQMKQELGSIIKEVFQTLIRVFILVNLPLPEKKLPVPIASPLSEVEIWEIEQIKTKIKQVGFLTQIRLVLSGSTKDESILNLHSVLGRLEQGQEERFNFLVKNQTLQTTGEIFSEIGRRFLFTKSFIIVPLEILNLISWKADRKDRQEEDGSQQEAKQEEFLKGEIVFPGVNS